MKIAIMGAGGVGGFYGARMARAGEDVTLIARGPHLEAIQKNGLRVESATVGNFSVKEVKATAEPAEVGPVELVWMTVKSYDLQAAAQAILPLIGPETAVISLMNGVDVAETIGAVVGIEHMLGGTVQLSAAIVAPGLIRHFTMDRMVFGELAGGISPRGEAIHRMLHGAGIEAELSPTMRRAIWEKFIFLHAIAGVGSLTRSPAGPMRTEPESRALYISCLREAEALARKKGIDVEEGVAEKFAAFVDNLPPETKPSMLLDLERGRPLELEALQGAVVRMGAELGVPVPVNEFIYAALRLHANGQA